MVAKIVKENNEGLLGKVFQSSWGYDQTNVNFYQVVSLKGKKTVEVREINNDFTATGDMTGTVIAKLDDFIGEKTLARRVLFYGSEPLIKINDSQRAYLMEDITKPCRTSSYA